MILIIWFKLESWDCGLLCCLLRLKSTVCLTYNYLMFLVVCGFRHILRWVRFQGADLQNANLIQNSHNKFEASYCNYHMFGFVLPCNVSGKPMNTDMKATLKFWVCLYMWIYWSLNSLSSHSLVICISNITLLFNYFYI